MKVLTLNYKSLNEIAEIFTGLRISRYTDESNNGKNVKVFKGKLSDIHNKDPEIEKMVLSDDIDKKFYSQKQDILLQVVGSSKTIKIVEQEGIIIPMNFIIIRVHEEYNPVFVFHLLNSVSFINILNRLSEGSSLQFVRIPDLRQIKLQIPDKKTQNEYGNLLELVDIKKNLEIKKIEISKQLETAIIMDKLGDKYVKL